MDLTNFKLGIGIPCNFDYVLSEFMDSYVIMEKPPAFEYLRAKANMPIELLRNDLVVKAIRLNCSHLLMLDSDMIYPPNTFVRLFETMNKYDYDAVSGLIWRRYPPFDPLMFRGDVGALELVDYEESEIIEIDTTGTGCMLYNMRAFHTVKHPWFEIVDNPAREGHIVGEDIGFHLKMTAGYGMRLAVDTQVTTSHMSLYCVNENAFLIHKAIQKSQAGGN
jgi:hypothetical protein